MTRTQTRVVLNPPMDDAVCQHPSYEPQQMETVEYRGFEIDISMYQIPSKTRVYVTAHEMSGRDDVIYGAGNAAPDWLAGKLFFRTGEETCEDVIEAVADEIDAYHECENKTRENKTPIGDIARRVLEDRQ